jgi:hypothetical protein
MKSQSAAREFEEALGLESCLIGVRYGNEPDPRGNAERKLAARYVECQELYICRSVIFL